MSNYSCVPYSTRFESYRAPKLLDLLQNSIREVETVLTYTSVLAKSSIF